MRCFNEHCTFVVDYLPACTDHDFELVPHFDGPSGDVLGAVATATGSTADSRESRRYFAGSPFSSFFFSYFGVVSCFFDKRLRKIVFVVVFEIFFTLQGICSWCFFVRIAGT